MNLSLVGQGAAGPGIIDLTPKLCLVPPRNVFGGVYFYDLP